VEAKSLKIFPFHNRHIRIQSPLLFVLVGSFIYPPSCEFDRGRIVLIMYQKEEKSLRRVRERINEDLEHSIAYYKELVWEDTKFKLISYALPFKIRQHREEPKRYSRKMEHVFRVIHCIDQHR
jgi:hypothetical protein